MKTSKTKKLSFQVPGMVYPSEYDWKRQFADAAKASRKDLEPYRVFDVGKVMGIVQAYEEALELIKEQSKTIDDLSIQLHLAEDIYERSYFDD